MWIKPVALSCAALALAALPSFDSQVKAQASEEPQTLDSAEALAVDAKLYAQQYGVSEEEALRRLSAMLDLGADVASETVSEGADFAGAYFDNDTPQFGVVVRTKKAGSSDRILTRKARRIDRTAARREARRTQRQALRAQFKLSEQEVAAAEDILAQDIQVPLRKRGAARFSLRELNGALTNGADSLKAVAGLQTTYVDQKTGEVVLMVDAPSAEAATSAANSVLKVPFRVTLIPGGFVDVAVRGGSFTSEQGRQWCMTAFAARRTSDNRTGLVTAGHCASSNTISIRDSDGTTKALTQSGTVDNPTTMDLMFLSGDPVAVAEFFYDNSGLARSMTGTRGRGSTTVGNGTYTAASTVPGSFVCHLGQASLGSSTRSQSCGEVISTTGSRVTGATTGGQYVVIRNTQSGAGTIRSSGTGTLTCFQGDSGGPVFANTIAFGVVSACQWEGGVLNGTSSYLMYTSTDYFSSIGVSILVK
jgi:hypothetical protein